MRLVDPRALLALASLGGVLWLLVLDLERTSPGELHRSHAEDRLAAPEGCALCHGEGEQTLEQACNACHTDIALQGELERGLHGRLAPDERADCGNCHLEHHGADAPLVGPRGFQLAGWGERASFDHAVVDFSLDGRHEELECQKCHALADAPFLAEGEQRFLGLEAGCVACHQDGHEGVMLRACATCHDTQHDFADVTSFRHARFDAGGAHASLKCAACHADAEHSIERLASTPAAAALDLDERDCASCHDSPHDDAFVQRADELSSGTSCAACHSAYDPSFAEPAAEMPRELHAASGMSLSGPHGELACADCHAVAASPAETGEPGAFAARYPGRSARDCAACHADPHEGQFAPAQGAAPACIACHSEQAFAPSTFDVTAHVATSFPLRASHAAVACTECHTAQDPAPPRFAGTPADCASCHADAHGGRLEAPADADARDCARCHRESLFADVRPEFDHDTWTSFVLDGAHAPLECAACHPANVLADAAGRRFGFAHAVFGEPVGACATCHADPHGGMFDTPALPSTVLGRAGCARCHTTTSFRAVASGFAHGRWTGYALDGPHASASCEACHAELEAGMHLGARLGPAPGRSCADCHTDPHVGQFDRDGRADCARCHSDTTELRFDHDRDARFALDERHDDLACDACHLPARTPSGGSAIRYKPLGTQCADCHRGDVR